MVSSLIDENIMWKAKLVDKDSVEYRIDKLG